MGYRAINVVLISADVGSVADADLGGSYVRVVKAVGGSEFGKERVLGLEQVDQRVYSLLCGVVLGAIGENVATDETVGTGEKGWLFSSILFLIADRRVLCQTDCEKRLGPLIRGQCDLVRNSGRRTIVSTCLHLYLFMCMCVQWYMERV